MDRDATWGNICEACPPNVIRDIVRSIACNYCDALGINPAWSVNSPVALLIAVFLGSLI